MKRKLQVEVKVHPEFFFLPRQKKVAKDVNIIFNSCEIKLQNVAIV